MKRWMGILLVVMMTICCAGVALTGDSAQQGLLQGSVAGLSEG